MIKKLHLNLLFLFLFFFPSVSPAQQPIFPLNKLETQGACVYTIQKDHAGTLWLGTSDGLVSYGQYLSRLTSDDLFQKSVNGIFVGIYEDNLGRLWLMEQSNHYVIYDPLTNKSVSDDHIEGFLARKGIPVRYDFRLISDSRRMIWVYKGHDLWLYDAAKGRVMHRRLPKSYGRIIGMNAVRDLVLVATEHRVLVTKAGMMAPHVIAVLPSPLNVAQDYLRMTMTRRGDLWLTTSQWILFYHAREHRWRSVDNSFHTSFPTIALLPNDHLLIGTTREGIMEYDADGNFLKNYRSNPFWNGSLTSNHIQSIYPDPSGNYVLVSYSKHGLSTYLTRQQLLISTPVGITGGTFLNDVITAFPGQGNTFYLGTEDNGVYVMDAGNPQVATKQLFPGQTVTGLLEDRQGRLCAGLYSEGLACSDGRRFFPNYSPYKIIDIGSNRLMVILNGFGLNVLDMTTGKTVHLKTDDLWMQDMTDDKDHVYTTTAKDIYIIDKQTLRIRTVSKRLFAHGDDGISDVDLFLDSRGWLWMVRSATHLPMRIYDTHTGKGYTLNEFGKFHVSSVCEDRQHRMWLATDRGMVCATVTNRQKPAFSYLVYGSFADTPYYNSRAMALLHNGAIVAGTSTGIQFFNPGQFHAIRKEKMLHRLFFLSGMRVNGNATSFDQLYPDLRHGDDIAGRPVALSSDDRHVVLYLIPHDVLSMGPRNCYYRMDQGDNWMSVDNFRIVLPSLSSGTHKIWVRESDPVTGANTEYLLATLHVAYPWYLSWWAWLIYVILVGTAVGVGLTWLRRRQEYLRNLRERDMKLKFFTDISHALRMPLSLIVSPVEDLMFSVKVPETHKILSMIYQNAKRLVFLVNKTLDFRKLEDAETQQTILYDDELAKEVVITPDDDQQQTTEDAQLPVVLVVEDSVELLSFLVHVLGKEYHVCQATDGSQALDILKTTTVDLIVSDVTMPGMNGLELCHFVKTDVSYSHIPVILLTARALASDELKGLEMGADDYITKPFHIDILRHRIRYLLDRTQAAHDRFAQVPEVTAEEITTSTIDEQLMQKAMEIVKEHLSDTSFTAEVLSKEMGMSRTNFYRKLMAVTGKTPAAFIRTLRLKHGRQMLEHDPKLFVSQVAYECGFANPKIFSRYFKEEFGLYPKEMK